MTEIKRGPIKFYHRGLLSKKWKEYRFILYDSSLLTWYSDIKHRKPDGMVLLKDVERFICVGPYTKYLPDFPHLENEYDQVTLIAFPLSVQNRDRDIVWLMCEDIQDLNSWMKAIVETLPSHTLRMENVIEKPSAAIEPSTPVESENNTTDDTDDVQAIEIGAKSVALPLVAGLVGNCLQKKAMNAKRNPLQRYGYDYGDTLWGTGVGWGHFSPLATHEYTAHVNGITYPERIELELQEQLEQEVEEQNEIEERNEENEDLEENIEEAVYELGIDDNDNEEVQQNDQQYDDGIEDELRMIDTDEEK